MPPADWQQHGSPAVHPQRHVRTPSPRPSRDSLDWREERLGPRSLLESESVHVLASTMIHVVPQGWLPANDEPMPQRQQPLRR
jgi:hypothetical protein